MLVSNFVIDYFIRTIKSFETFSDDEITKIKYSLQSILWEIEKILILSAIFFLLHRLDYFIITFIILLSIRINAGGYHSKTSFGCLIVTFLAFYLSICIMPLLKVDHAIFYLFSVCSVVINIAFAPIVSKQKEKIISKAKKNKQKIISSFLMIFWLIFMLIHINNPYAICVLWIIFFQSIQLSLVYYQRKIML